MRVAGYFVKIVGTPDSCVHVGGVILKALLDMFVAFYMNTGQNSRRRKWGKNRKSKWMAHTYLFPFSPLIMGMEC